MAETDANERMMRALWELALDAAAVGDPTDTAQLPQLVDKAAVAVVGAVMVAAGGDDGG